MTAITYAGRTAVLATKHHKEQAIRGPLRAHAGIDVVVPPGLDTDQLGTFSGEVERDGIPSEVVVRKARLGMEAAGVPFGLASEGSFRPHAELSFETGSHEVLAFVDDENGVVIIEDLFTLDTNFANAKVRPGDDIEGFLARVGFPAHALIAVPNDRIEVGHDDRVRLVLEEGGPQQLFKEIADRVVLNDVITRCAAMSADGIVHVETDMRAHLNPTRMVAIARLAEKLARRLATPCPACGAPGWGAVKIERLPSNSSCEGSAPAESRETHGCLHCGHTAAEPVITG